MLVQKRKIYKVSVGLMLFFISMNERKKWKTFYFHLPPLHIHLPVDTNRFYGNVLLFRFRKMLLFSLNVLSCKIVISIFLKKRK